MTTITKRNSIVKKLLLFLAMIAMANVSQATSIFISPLTKNCTQTANNKIRFDVYVKNTGTDELGYRSHTLRFTMSRSVMPAGAQVNGSVQYVPGTGDPRLSALQATYNGASSFTISATVAQVNLGGGGTVYDQNTSPRVLPGDSIWLGSFIVTAPVPWVTGSNSTPAWVTGTPCSVSVYDLPPNIATATVCNSTGTGLLITSGLLQNGIVTTNNPSGAGSPPCSMLLNGCSFAGAPTVVHASCGATPTGSVSTSVTGTNGDITYTLNPGAIVIGPTALTTVTFGSLMPGSYTITYADAIGCGGTTASVTVNPGSGAASDGNACTQDVCNTDGSTSHPPVTGIDDSNVCTADACNTLTGDITHSPNPLIDDGNACTNDVCNSLTGTITHPAVIPENDGNACTQDICVSSGNVTTIFNEDFDGIPGSTAGGPGTYSFPTGWSLFNVDNRVPASAVSFVNDAWERREDFFFTPTDSCAYSTSWYTPAGQADDWMVTPAINTGSTSTLSWNALAGDPAFPDGYEVRIFTTPPTAANLLSSTVLLTIPAENTDAFTPRSVSLAAYSNQTVYIAFRNHSDDMFLLLIDDVEVKNGALAGSTIHVPIPPQNDGNACTQDVCNSITGATDHNAIPPVNDGNACTNDVCNTLTGATDHPPIPTTDGNACTIDGCNTATGGLTHTPDPLINDNDPCTVDACNTSTGAITHTPDPSINDGNACTVDGCTTAGVPTHTPNPLINDGDPCTVDACNTISGTITHTPDPAINDGNACTIDGCNSLGVPFHNPDPAINDGNACTIDACNTSTGAISHTNNPLINDGNACTIDICITTTGAISHNPDPAINDGNACTIDICITTTGAISHNPDPLINDGNACTIDICITTTGAISHNPDPLINDGNLCTSDACNTVTGAITHTDLTQSDGINCTNDVCNSLTGITNHSAYSISVAATQTGPPIACFGGTTCVLVSSFGGIGTITYSDGNITQPSPNFCNTPAGGAYFYTASDINGCLSPPSNPVLINQPPKLEVVDILSTPSGCTSNDGTATVFAVGGTGTLSYLWNPGGATTSHVTGIGGGTYTVTIRDLNQCTIQASVLVGSSGTTLPAPGPISGPAGGCRNSFGYDYSVPAVPGALSYTWTVPATATIIDGQGTNAIIVNFNSNFAGGFITVKDSNACGASPIAFLNVPLLTAKPAKPELTGPSIVCKATVAVYCATSLRATSISWVVNHGLIILAGQGTGCITVQIPANYDGGGEVKVRGANCKGTGDEKKIDVKLSKPPKPVITATGIPCKGGTMVFCASAQTATSYRWTVDHGLLIIGQGTSCITVQIPANYDGDGKVKVKGVNCNGIGDEAGYDLKLARPAKPAITGPSPVCAGNNYVYCASSALATSYNWTADHGLNILGGQGTSCITVQVPANYAGDGKIKVRGVNCNGTSDEASKDIKKTNVITAAVQFCGGDNPPAVCAPSTEKYHVCHIDDAACYTWSAPPGAVIHGNNGSMGNPLTLCEDHPEEVHISFPSGFISGGVSVSASNQCNSTGTVIMLVTGQACRLASEETISSNAVNAYPNPTSGKLNVVFNATAKEKYTLKVIDLLGNVLISEVHTAQEGNNLREIDLGNLAKGMYLVSIERDATGVQTMRIVVE